MVNHVFTLFGFILRTNILAVLNSDDIKILIKIYKPIIHLYCVNNLIASPEQCSITLDRGKTVLKCSLTPQLWALTLNSVCAASVYHSISCVFLPISQCLHSVCSVGVYSVC